MQGILLALLGVIFFTAPFLPLPERTSHCDLETRKVGGNIQYRCTLPPEIQCTNCGVTGNCTYYGASGLHYCNCEGVGEESRDNCYTKIDSNYDPPVVFCIEVCCDKEGGTCPTYQDSPWPAIWTELCVCNVY